MITLKDDPNVNFTAVEPVYKEWHKKSEGLSGPAAAIIAIAIGVATQGVGSGLVGATSKAGIAASNAAFSGLVAQASVATINNGGNIFAAFEDLVSIDTVRSLAASALTAGLTQQFGGDLGILGQPANDTVTASVLGEIERQLVTAGISTAVDSVVLGVDFSDTLVNNLRFAGAAVIGAQVSQEIGTAFNDGDIDRGTQLIAHAALGCAAGAVGSGNCGAGSVSQLAGEISSIIHGEITVENIEDVTQEFAVQNVNIARLSGGIAAAIAGGDADDINLGANLGGIAAENNNLLTILAAATAAAARGCSKIKSCSVKAGQQASKIVSKLRNKPLNFDDLLKRATKTPKQGSGKVVNHTLKGNFNTANKSFDALKPKNIITKSNGDRIGTLSDGRQIIVRPKSKTGPATLEVHTKNIHGKIKKIEKIRFE